MQKYEEPVVQITAFAIEDVITASGLNTPVEGGGGNGAAGGEVFD